MASLNTCLYIGRHGDVCGKNCLANHTESTRCSLHRGKINSVKCLGCDCWTRSMSQLCTACNKKNKKINLTPFLLTEEEINIILNMRKKERGADSSDSE